MVVNNTNNNIFIIKKMIIEIGGYKIKNMFLRYLISIGT